MSYKKKYEGIKPKAVKGLTNSSGIAIFDVEYGIDDYVISAFCVGENYTNYRRTKIYYNAKGENYFIRNGLRYYINEFIRTDY